MNEYLLVVKEERFEIVAEVIELNSGEYVNEISITGKNPIQIRKEFAKSFLPFSLFAGTDSVSEIPFLKGKSVQSEAPVIYVCRNYSCQNPVSSVQEAIQQLTTH